MMRVLSSSRSGPFCGHRQVLLIAESAMMGSDDSVNPRPGFPGQQSDRPLSHNSRETRMPAYQIGEPAHLGADQMFASFASERSSTVDMPAVPMATPIVLFGRSTAVKKNRRSSILP